MNENLHNEKLKKSIEESKENIRKRMEQLKTERRITFTLNLIFFFGIMISTIVITFFTIKGELNFSELFTISLTEKLSLISLILTLFISFLIGISVARITSNSLRTKNEFDLSAFLKDTYIKILEKSHLNPKNKQ